MFENHIQAIPKAPGSYLLWLHLAQSKDLSVGKLGCFRFLAGEYIYLGSALGPGGLRARLGRHTRGKGQPHWHIDYLRTACQVRGFGFSISDRDPNDPMRGITLECEWSRRLAEIPGIIFPVSRFGASDCRSSCAAHLVYSSDSQYDIAERITDKIGIFLRWL